HDDLEGIAPIDFAKPIEVSEDEMGPLIPGHSASERDDRPLLIEHLAGRLRHRGDETPLRPLMRVPNRLVGQLLAACQPLRLMGPARKNALEQFRERWMRPCRDMNPVGDRAHLVAWEHKAGRLGMDFRHTIHMPAEVEREERHVELVLATQLLEQVGVYQPSMPQDPRYLAI